MAFTSLALLFSGLNAHASIVISTTRIILNQQKGEAVAQLTNRGKSPLLVQAWIDDGNANADPTSIQVPFSITPSIARIDPGKGQTVRIFSQNNNLPKNRESLFWFNVLEVPPVPNSELLQSENFMQIALRTRIKLFYRPASLSISPSAAYELLSFELHPTNNQYAVVVKNPSPYYITFNRLELQLTDKTTLPVQMEDSQSKMIAPFSETVLPVPGLKNTPAAGAKFFYLIINDSGGTTRGEKPLTR